MNTATDNADALVAELQRQYPGNFPTAADAEPVAGRIRWDIDGDMPPRLAIAKALEAYGVFEDFDAALVSLEEAYRGRVSPAA